MKCDFIDNLVKVCSAKLTSGTIKYADSFGMF